MNELEKQILEIYEQWAQDPAVNLIPLFEIMKKKYPAQMMEAFKRGLNPASAK